MTEKQVEIIVLHERVMDSWLSDLGTFCMIVAIIGTGWWLGSEAMQWAGFGMLAVGAMTVHRRRDRMTPQQAADHLARVHGVRATEDAR